jgi:N-acetylglucosamine kinase-like BadF-type ATPase
MWIVVDSGSTKADWALIGQNTKKIISTMGFNPYFHNPEKVYSELTKDDFTREVPIKEIKNVFFYGAGCSDDYYCSSMKKGLQKVFSSAIIEVEHDLLGAARATCGHSAGISGILGTGSNSCSYDGKQVTDNITALSHVLGDEGSGVHLGKLILQSYFYRELPEDLESSFNITYPEGKREIIHRVYGEGQNVKIAEFAQFVVKNKNHPFIKKLIQQAFREFTQRHLKKYKNWNSLPINLVGSIADMLKEDLSEVLNTEGLKLGLVIRRPIEKLIDYHS